MASIIAEFEIPFWQYLDNTGVLSGDTPPFYRDTARLLALYRVMVLTRLFDAKAIALQRTGKLGTYPSIRGQEAVFAGIGEAMAPDDVFVPYYRDVGVLIQRGATLTDILLYWGGDERGNLYAGPHNFPYCVPIGSQLPQAAGIATALKIQGKRNAVLAVCGDGATSEGDFYEALNVAGIWSLPIVFVINNNQWAISVPRSAQTAAKTLAQKAIAAGILGEQVDGNDVVAVAARVREALSVAREKCEPRLIEMTCYRHGDHTTADDASRYETAGIRAAEWEKEPVARLKRCLERMGVFSPEQEAALQAECSVEVEAAVAKYLSMAPEPLSALFDYLYATLPAEIIEQRDAFLAGVNSKERSEQTHG